MPGLIRFPRLFVSLTVLFLMSAAALAQRSAAVSNSSSDSDFGPVMSAYLGYLRNEQEVVDDRASRREITPAYYRRNLNRIHALRETAIRLVRQSGNDYVPELEAVTQDELGMLFETPPKTNGLRANELVANKFRFLAEVRSGEVFYVFARLDPYEQAELIQRQKKDPAAITTGPASRVDNGRRPVQPSTRPRRAGPH